MGVLTHLGISTKVLNSIKGLMCKTKSVFWLTDSFHTSMGIKQDCLLSPLLFLFIYKQLLKSNWMELGCVCNKRIKTQAYVRMILLRRHATTYD